MRTLIGGKDLLFIGGTFLIKSFPTDHYQQGVQMILHADKAVPWIERELEKGNKVIIYKQQQDYKFSAGKRITYGPKKWVKLMDVQRK